MASLAEETIFAFLTELGRKYRQPADLLLLGGSALCLLGSPRPTLDIDYVGDDLNKTEFQHNAVEITNSTRLRIDWSTGERLEVDLAEPISRLKALAPLRYQRYYKVVVAWQRNLNN